MTVGRRLVLLFLFVALGLSGCHASKRPAARSPSADGGATVAAWATWPMPNSTPGLPHPQSFDTSRDEVAVDAITGLMWQRNVVANPTSFAGAKQECDRARAGGLR